MKKHPLYQPRIPDELIRRLYRAKLATGQPMTVLVRQAIEHYLRTIEQQAA